MKQASEVVIMYVSIFKKMECDGWHTKSSDDWGDSTAFTSQGLPEEHGLVLSERFGKTTVHHQFQRTHANL